MKFEIKNFIKDPEYYKLVCYHTTPQYIAAVSTFCSHKFMIWSDWCLEVKNWFYKVGGLLGGFCVDISIFLLF